ncbi:serine hydrolase [Kutzneria sp. CA-103260]|uniref:serine hydrolase n=1 Tax=Kutzneria sp. CA-103260 TaxID=2802641 RepID=UPI001BA852BE|nr:serine hydrolase [Kutzneria sp. CA-103260]QUQ63973.1 beta-lactamase/prolyl oligopeptidase [Kutzneria sp. CA-103260]
MTRRLRIADLTAVATPEKPVLSPDGRQIMYVLRTQDTDADRVISALWRVDTAGGEPVWLTRGPGDSAPAWSPDGTRVAFLRAADGPGQLWVLPANGGEPVQLSTLPLGAGRPVWSPDGKSLAFTAPVDIAANSVASKPIVTDRLNFQADGVGFLGTMRAHVHVLDVATGDCRQVTEGDWNAGEPAWSPDGDRLAFAAAMGEDVDLDLRAGVYVLDVTDRRNRPVLAGFDTGVAGAVGWTADGQALLVAGNADGPVGQSGLFRLPVSGVAELTNLAESLDRNVMTGAPGYPGGLPQLADSGTSVLFCVRDRGCTHLYRVGVDGGTPDLVLGGDDCVVSALSVAGDTAAVVLSTATSFGEVVTVDLTTGVETVRTKHGDNLADVEWFAREAREFTISDGTVVHGWLIRDPERTGPVPLLLDIHGGPHNAWNGAADDVHLYHQELVARGWAVLLLNPRGSDGYGEAFYTAAIGAWGEADAKDFLEPLDTLVTEGIADPRRLAVAGYSYGGFMTCYLTSRDNRFAAAVAGGVVSDLSSMAGTSDMGHYLAQHELNVLSWRDGDRLATLSPITKVADVRTPTLVIQGTNDVRCPIGQAEQWHAALRERGVPTRLVLYPGGAHLVIVNGPPSHRIDFNNRVVDWVERYAGDATGPRPARLDQGHWQRRLAVLAERHRLPGAQLGILQLGNGDDDLVEAAYGVLNVDTGVEATTDSLFQIGSITKVWTATVAMQLVDEGKLNLDTPVVEVLPELRLSDPDVTKQLTLRHLLTHTSGIDGDVFTDTGRGDDCLEKYVGLLGDVAQNHPLGATWSYCNSGFTLAGRMIEKVTGVSWDAALRERLFKPLGLTHTVTLPEEALLFRAAVGHVGETEPTRAPVWTLPRSAGPAGLVTSTVADVLAFARLHLSGGLAADGTRLLSKESVAEMATMQADLPDKFSLGDSWGLGWIRFDFSGHRVIGHDGNTVGQAAFLRILPEQGLAVTLLTNGSTARDLYEDLFREIFAEVADVALPRPLTPPETPVEADITPWLGTYERASVRLDVLDGPVLRMTATGQLAEILGGEPMELPMTAVGPDLFVVRRPETGTWTPVTFYTLPGGAKYLHHGVRATPKVS